MSNIFWTGYSSGNRHQVITQIKEIVGSYGDIVDFKLFSDISIAIKIEIQEYSIDTMYDKLSEFMLLDEYTKLNSNSKKERVIYLNITFA